MNQAQIQLFAEVAAKKVFARRGDHSEAHISQPELTGIIMGAILAYEKLDVELAQRAQERRYQAAGQNVVVAGEPA